MCNLSIVQYLTIKILVSLFVQTFSPYICHAVCINVYVHSHLNIFKKKYLTVQKFSVNIIFGIRHHHAGLNVTVLL